MELDGCGYAAKIFFYLLNVILALEGLLLMVGGSLLVILAQSSQFFQMTGHYEIIMIGLILLIIMGLILIVAIIMVDVAKCSKSIDIYKAYISIISSALGMAIAVGISAYVSRQKVAAQLSDFYTCVYVQYVGNKHNTFLRLSLMLAQRMLDCCGVGGILEPFVQETCPGRDGFWNAITTPTCPNTLSSLDEAIGKIFLGSFIGTAVLLGLAILCCCVFVNSVKLARDRLQQNNLFHLIPQT
ncbi:CD9 antigen-like [Lepisosteus oculatus]|uniref:CD9 antigen-like n=1 Tax=Lepisosteus oculatus TaxID=7918 RepID=UPI00370FAE3E